MNKVSRSIFEKQKGQTLVVIIVLMVIALSIGIAISSKYIRGLRNITQADQASRALAVAEAAVEHILLLPISTVEDYAINGNCTTDCYLEITGADGQTIYANVELSVLGNSSDPYISELKVDEDLQVVLNGYPSGESLYVCWNQADMSVTGLYVHGTTGGYEADAIAYNPTTTTHGDNNFNIAAPLFGYNNCFTLTTKDDSALLRLKANYEENIVVIIPAGGTSLPTQGILIESTGVAGNAQKVVSVIITDPILPSQFDYVLWQKDPSEPLSN